MTETHRPEEGAAGTTREERMIPAGKFRTALPQVLASTAKNMILLDLGMTIAFPTIVIPALQNTTDPLAMDDEQTSWFGSIMFICQPVGSVLSGIILEHLGRKKSMILVNFPHVIGWFIFYFANSVTMLYVSSVIMGLGVGFMEAPIITYVGEISQPELRGMLTSYAGIFVQLGFFVEYLLGTVSTWRTAAAISAVIPIATVVAITQVPETPIWLLSRGRVDEARKALCWLRGWVPPINVKKEFDELVLYSENMKKMKNKSAENGGVEQETNRSGTFLSNARLLLKPQTLRPLLLVIMFFFFQHWSGFSGMRPYMVQVFDEFGLPLDGHWVTVVTGVIGMLGNLVCMLGVPWWGKRPISLVSMAVSAMCCILLGGYAYAVISPGEVVTSGTRNISSWAPLTIFVVLVFMQSVGVLPIPWMILSEVFPFRSRGLASGIAAAASYILAFLVSKTFLSIKAEFHLHGVFWLYGAFGIIGFILIFWTFSETEGRSLEEIENFYKKGIRGKIPKRVVAENRKESTTPVMSTSMVTIVKENGHRSNNTDEDFMINNTLFTKDKDKAHGVTNEAYSNTEDSAGILGVSNVDTTIDSKSATEIDDLSSAPEVPKKRKTVVGKDKENKEKEENETKTSEDESETVEDNSKETKTEEGKNDCVESKQEKVEVHKEAEVVERTQM